MKNFLTIAAKHCRRAEHSLSRRGGTAGIFKKIRVMILLPGFKRSGPVLGGIALAKHINKKTCAVVVGCLGKLREEYSPVMNELKEANIAIKAFDMPGWSGLRRMNVIHNYINEKKINILHSYGIRPDITNSMVSKNCISIASIRGMFRDEYRLKYGRIIGSIFSFLHIRALSRIKGIIVMSRAMEEFLQNEGFDKTKIHYIANFVDLSTIPEKFRK